MSLIRDFVSFSFLFQLSSISKTKNHIFVVISDFFRRNTNASDKTKLTAVFDTFAMDMASTFKVQLAFVKFHNHKVIYDLQMEEESGVSQARNTRGIPQNTTRTTDLYDITWILEQWKESQNHAKLKVEFNISQSTWKQPRKLVLKTWSKAIKGEAWKQYGPVFLLAYFKGVSTKIKSPLYSAVNAHRYNLRSGGSRATCKLYSFRATFAELGLSNVFVMPTKSIDFFVCYGQCDVTGSVNSHPSFVSTHAWILELARSRFSNPPIQKMYLKSKCVPTALQGMDVWRKGNDGSFTLQHIPDLTAAACGCR